jgi:hypothetical protein
VIPPGRDRYGHALHEPTHPPRRTSGSGDDPGRAPRLISIRIRQMGTEAWMEGPIGTGMARCQAFWSLLWDEWDGTRWPGFDDS